jgi:putative protease
MRAKEGIKCQLQPADINQLNRIFEGYDGLGIVSTLDRKAGLVVIHVTPEIYQDAMTIIRNAPFPVKILPE